MSITDSRQSTRPPDHESSLLRSELKQWEKAFAAAHHGRKASRDDIKQNPEIAFKYKLYTKLRNSLSSSYHDAEDPTPSSSPSKKRKLHHHYLPSSPPSQSQSQSHAHLQIFNKPPLDQHSGANSSQLLHPLHPSTLDPYDPPLAATATHRTPTARRTRIAPTPQKNGQVLGLFDALTPSSKSKSTPTKESLAALLATPSRRPTATPSKRRADNASVSDGNSQLETKQMEEGVAPGRGSGSSSAAKPTRTPPSASKRLYLRSFLTATPSTRRMADVAQTPSSLMSVGRRDLGEVGETPNFLRRRRVLFSSNIRDGNKDEENGKEGGGGEWSPVYVRSPPPGKPAGKGLRALVEGLRGMEDEAWGDEEDVLREREMEGGESQGRAGAVLVGDSQVGERKLGADGEGGSEEEEDLAGGKEGQGGAKKAWRKKGQKRTTRRVTMKPNVARWQPEPEWKAGAGDEHEGEEEAVIVRETQQASQGAADSCAADTPFDPDVDPASQPMKSNGKRKPNPALASTCAPPLAQDIDSKTTAKSRKKKIPATAHANFRALKIKNKSSKAKRAGGSGRFARRR